MIINSFPKRILSLKGLMVFITYLSFLLLTSCQQDDFDQDFMLDLNSIESSATSDMVNKTKGKLKDIEDNVYKTIKIGKQWWMAENLKTTMYNDGTPIPYVDDNLEWKGISTPAYCWYDNEESTYKATYGALYKWQTVNTGKLCPKGWHVPSDAEWKILEMYLGMTQEQSDMEGPRGAPAGGKLKETGLDYWWEPNFGATNETGFTALPGGVHVGIPSENDFSGIGEVGCWWSSTPFFYGSDLVDAWKRFTSYGEANIGRDHPSIMDGLSVRCLKD